MEELTCPICQHVAKNERSLALHIGKSFDPEHILLSQYRKQNVDKLKKLGYAEFYSLFKTESLASKEKKEDEEVEINKKEVKESVRKKQLDEYMKIPCECSHSCKDCYKSWRADFFNDCRHERRSAFIEEYNIGKEIEVRENNALDLVKYFYSLGENECQNWAIECKLIKNLLTKKERRATTEDIKYTMRYMNAKGHRNIMKINYCLQDAIEEKRILEASQVEGNSCFLLKRFYDGNGIDMNIQNIISENMKIYELIKISSYEEAKETIEYMIKHSITNINFIFTKRVEMLSLKKQKLNKNPSFFDQGSLAFLIDEVRGGRMNIKKIEGESKEKIISEAEQILFDESFDQRYTAFEWAWRVGLTLRKETYEAALNMSACRKKYIDSMIEISQQNSEKLQKLLLIKEKFNLWLSQQDEIFS